MKMSDLPLPLKVIVFVTAPVWLLPLFVFVCIGSFWNDMFCDDNDGGW